MSKIKTFIKKVTPSFVIKIYRTFKEIPKVKMYNAIQDSYVEIVSQVKAKARESGKLRVGFYIVFDSSWGSRPVFEKMLTNDFFEPRIVVCPDVARGLTHEKEVLSKVYRDCCDKYGEKYVICSYDSKSFSYKDYSDCFDVIFIANPYDTMTDRVYTVDYLAKKKKKLTVFCDYGYSGKLQ